MIIIKEEKYNPIGAIMMPFKKDQQIFNRLYYLCGSDFYFNEEHNNWDTDCNMIYNIRKIEFLTRPDPYKAKGGTRIRLRTTDFEKEISSTKIREDILKMKTSFDLSVANEIKDTIGIGSYCYLGDIDYLKIPKPSYGLKQMGCPGQSGGGDGDGDGDGNGQRNTNTSKRKTLKNNKLKSRKIKKLTSTYMTTTRFTKKKHHSNHSNNKKRKTRRSKH
jgi:hypothetical protein